MPTDSSSTRAENVKTVNFTLWVDVFGQFQSIRVGQVSVGGGDSQNKAALSRYELHDHIMDLMLDVCWLISHWHFSDAGQVDERQIQHCEKTQRQQTSKMLNNNLQMCWTSSTMSVTEDMSCSIIFYSV